MNLFDLITEYKVMLTAIAASSVITAAIIALWMGKAKFKWYVNELIKMYSGEPSFFSKKRVDSGIAFMFALWMTIFYLHKRIDNMDIWAFGYILTVWLFIAGYTVAKIESSKVVEQKLKEEKSSEKKPSDVG